MYASLHFTYVIQHYEHIYEHTVGHGSHVAGSLAGECLASLINSSDTETNDRDFVEMSSYNGMVRVCYKARV
jgi:hypothetical protein